MQIWDGNSRLIFNEANERAFFKREKKVVVSPLRVLTFPSQCAAITKNQKGMALLGQLIRGVSRNTLLTRWESHWIYARNQVHQADIVSSKSKTYRLARLLRQEARLLGS